MTIRDGREHAVPVRPAEVGRCTQRGDRVLLSAHILHLRVHSPRYTRKIRSHRSQDPRAHRRIEEQDTEDRSIEASENSEMPTEVGRLLECMHEEWNGNGGRK